MSISISIFTSIIISLCFPRNPALWRPMDASESQMNAHLILTGISNSQQPWSSRVWVVWWGGLPILGPRLVSILQIAFSPLSYIFSAFPLPTGFFQKPIDSSSCPGGESGSEPPALRLRPEPWNPHQGSWKSCGFTKKGMNDAVKAEVLGGGLLGEVRSSPMVASAWERGSQLSGTQCRRLTFPLSSGGRSLLGHPVECLQGSETETMLLRASPSLPHSQKQRWPSFHWVQLYCTHLCVLNWRISVHPYQQDRKEGGRKDALALGSIPQFQSCLCPFLIVWPQLSRLGPWSSSFRFVGHGRHSGSGRQDPGRLFYAPPCSAWVLWHTARGSDTLDDRWCLCDMFTLPRVGGCSPPLHHIFLCSGPRLSASMSPPSAPSPADHDGFFSSVVS